MGEEEARWSRENGWCWETAGRLDSWLGSRTRSAIKGRIDWDLFEDRLHGLAFLVVFVVVSILAHAQVLEDLLFVGFAKRWNAFREQTAKFEVVVPKEVESRGLAEKKPAVAYANREC